MTKELKRVEVRSTVLITEVIEIQNLPPASFLGIAIDINNTVYNLWRDYYDVSKTYAVKQDKILYYSHEPESLNDLF